LRWSDAPASTNSQDNKTRLNYKINYKYNISLTQFLAYTYYGLSNVVAKCAQQYNMVQSQ
jgi:hypothetical protein